jgi:hypothetical protein
MTVQFHGVVVDWFIAFQNHDVFDSVCVCVCGKNRDISLRDRFLKSWPVWLMPSCMLPIKCLHWYGVPEMVVVFSGRDSYQRFEFE